MNQALKGNFSLNRLRPAFSLVELIAVIAIIAILLSLLAPAIGSMAGIAARKGAASILMNTMEQARAAALESGRMVYVVFYRRIFPEQDSILVLRDPDPATESAELEALTRWIKLPKGILLRSAVETDILSESMPDASSGGFSFDAANSPLTLDPAPGESMNVLAFNGCGGVSFPISAKLMLAVGMGTRGGGGAEILKSKGREKSAACEIISLRRWTGRASLEATTL